MTAKTKKSWISRSIRLVAFMYVTTAFAPVGSATPAGRTLWEWSDGPFHSRLVLWTAGDLTEPNLRQFYRELSQELRGKEAWKVDVCIDERDGTREIYGKLRTESDYDWWLKLYTEFGRKPLPLAEISAYRNNAVLRLRNTAGVSSEVVLSGENFLRMRLDGVAFEILKTYYHGLPPGTSPSPGDEAMISIYVRTSSYPGSSQAEDFVRTMRARYNQKRIIVSLRTDAFFLTDGAFPITYRFDPPGEPPTRELYKASKTMYCVCEGPDIRCR